ncbi:MAG: hypothetical protein RIT24_631 [Planctomycetota bacterium]
MFRSADLKSARFQMYRPGCPKVYSGNFASTFVATSPAGRKMAVRVFLKPDPLNRDLRYQQISAFLQSRRPPAFADFRYLTEEVLSNGRRWPVITMEWVEGDTLDLFMTKATALGKPELLQSLRQTVLQVSRSLEDLGCAHGDLNTGNILVSNDLRSGLKLVDYDGMFVPGMQAGEAGAPGEEGTPGTRHPRRRRMHFGAQVDRFSCIVIDVCAAALIELPAEWKTLNTDPSRLLFDESDFQNPSGSKAFQVLRQRGSPTLRNLLDALARVACEPPERCPSLAEFQRIAGSPSLPRAGERVTLVPHVAASVPSPPVPAVRLLERPAIDGSNYGAMRAACDSEIDMVGRIFEEPVLRKDRNGNSYLFVNLRAWKRGQSVRLTIWGDAETREFFAHAELVAKIHKGKFQNQWICVTGTPQHYSPHDSVDITPNSMGHVRFIDSAAAADMLRRTADGHVRGAHAPSGLPAAGQQAAGGGGLVPNAASIQSENERTLAALRAGLTSKPAAAQANAAASGTTSVLSQPLALKPAIGALPAQRTTGTGSTMTIAGATAPTPSLASSGNADEPWLRFGMYLLTFILIGVLLGGCIRGCSRSASAGAADTATSMPAPRIVRMGAPA